MIQLDPKRSNYDQCTYYLRLMSQATIKEIINFLNQNFEVRDRGEIKYCLGVEFKRKNDEIVMLPKSLTKWTFFVYVKQKFLKTLDLLTHIM